MTVYYLGRGDNQTNIQPFPPGFRMLSGVATARSYDTQTLIPGSDRPKADRVSFACLDIAPSKEQPGMTRTSCVNGLRAQIHFQSCWDGINLYKEDNSHVEYMSGLDNGVCPSTHPVPLIHLFYEVLYGVKEIKQDGGKFVFSQGDTTGFGFHGDFLNGWDPATLKSALDQGCATTPGGAVGDCAAFKASDNPASFAQSCPERPALVKEPVHGMINKLPGCITITSGPGAAKEADMSCSPGADQAAADQASMNGTASMGNSTAPYTNNTTPSADTSIDSDGNGYDISGSTASAADPSSASDDSYSTASSASTPSAASDDNYSTASSASTATQSSAAPASYSAVASTSSSASYGADGSTPSQPAAASTASSMSADADDNNSQDYTGTDTN